jgi:hypothetical protein
MFDIVRRRVQKFMTLVSNRGRQGQTYTNELNLRASDIWDQDSIQHYS